MRAVVVGAVESTRVALSALAANPRWSVLALVTLPSTMAGRHSDFVDLSPDAAAVGAQVLFAPNSNAPDVVEKVRALVAVLAFFLGLLPVCPPPFLDPIDDEVDHGPILAQKFLHVAPDETATTLYAGHMDALGALLEQSLDALADGRAPKIVQDERFATYAARRTDRDGCIDWTGDAATVQRLIRAVTRPYPGAYTHLAGERLTIWSAELWPDASRHAAMPGQIVEKRGERLAIACGEGAILATDWTIAKDEVRVHAVLGKQEP